MTSESVSQPILRLKGLKKDYGQGEVLHGLDLDVYPGEFLTLLGPSGCGKTTTLRIVAGLERPSEGQVFLDEQDVTSLPPEKRGVNTVFQNYALFPHMNVFQNIAYGLRVQRVDKAEQKQRVEEALELVQLAGYGKRMPQQLSGGQRQRVAIARALVLRPKLLLLDEPLGALDLKLRQDMQGELKKLQRQLGITFIYITHDQEEALNMSTRIVIMREGHIEQIGSPEAVYERPETLFCADFIGQSNLLTGTLEAMPQAASAGGQGESQAADPSGTALQSGVAMTLSVNGLSLPVLLPKDSPLKAGDNAALCLRPQRVFYEHSPVCGMSLTGIIQSKEYAGGMQHTRIALTDALALTAVSQAAELDTYQIGEKVNVGWDVRHAPLVPVDAPQATGQAAPAQAPKEGER